LPAEPRLTTARLELRPLPAAAAAALPRDRETAARILRAGLGDAWPQTDLLDVLPLQAMAARGEEPFGIWVIVERETGTVVGDIGFTGPPGDTGALELGYSVVADRRRRGYATEAARAIIDWALGQLDVSAVFANCDEDNVASIRTLERLSFARTSTDEGKIRWKHRGASSR
jgi:ribosomal-protein-alanine N-acetyltransferase